MNIPQIPMDKANHAAYGAVAFLVGALVGVEVHLSPSLFGLAFSAGLGVVKEAADAFGNWRATGDPMVGPHSVEFLDFAATTIGGVVCYIAAWVA